MALVLEWMPGGTLTDLLSNDALDLKWEDSLLRLACDVARGMAYLHAREYFDESAGAMQRCILHRDVKASPTTIPPYSITL